MTKYDKNPVQIMKIGFHRSFTKLIRRPSSENTSGERIILISYFWHGRRARWPRDNANGLHETHNPEKRLYIISVCHFVGKLALQINYPIQ